MNVNEQKNRQELCVASRQEWRAWLKKNHTSVAEIWLVYYKKHTGKASIAYADSVEEALCFGWIDGLKRRLDEERYVHRFTPRKPRSKWSPLNIKRARSMIKEGKMTRAGLSSFKLRLNYDDAFLEAKSTTPTTLPSWIEEALTTDEKAWFNFNQLAPGYRKQYIGWLSSAKRPETRDRRVQEAIRLLRENRKPGM